jgi:hypothetical protein
VFGGEGLPDVEVPMPEAFSVKEREVLRHATGWNSAQPQFRNHYCTSPGGDDWETIQALCARGMMRIGRKPSALSGGDTIFVVTDAGIEGLRADAKLLDELADPPVDVETAAWLRIDDRILRAPPAPWNVVTEFAVLYQSAEAALEALPEVGDRRADAIGALRTELRRLRPAFEQCQAVRALARRKEG